MTGPVIIAASAVMQRALDLARRFAPTGMPILLVGPTGTGKEVMAQAIHRWSGVPGALVDIDCGSLPTGMAASVLFGHRRGSFTGAIDSMPGLLEQAHHGTLFLDELSSLPPEGQAVLLRVLETGESRRVGEQSKRHLALRLVAAIQHGPGGGAFGLREDLYQRLAGGIIHLPALSSRREDIWPLALLFATRLGRSLSLPTKALLESRAWPGNVRELRHTIERATHIGKESVLDTAAVAEAFDDRGANENNSELPSPQLPLGEECSRAELELLCQAHDGHAASMAAALGVSRATLYRRLARVGLRLRYGIGRNQEILMRNLGI